MTLRPHAGFSGRFHGFDRKSEPFTLPSDSFLLLPRRFLPLDYDHSGICFLSLLPPAVAEELRELGGVPAAVVHLLVLAGGGGRVVVLGAEVAHVAVHLVHAPADSDWEGLGQQVVVDGGHHVLLDLVRCAAAVEQEPDADGREDPAAGGRQHLVAVVGPHHPVGHQGAGEHGGAIGPAQSVIGQVGDDGVGHQQQLGSPLEVGDLVHGGLEVGDLVHGGLEVLVDSDVVSVVVQLPPDSLLRAGNVLHNGVRGGGEGKEQEGGGGRGSVTCFSGAAVHR